MPLSQTDLEVILGARPKGAELRFPELQARHAPPARRAAHDGEQLPHRRKLVCDILPKPLDMGRIADLIAESPVRGH